MILVTGAAGKTGQAAIRALSARGATIRALVRRPEQVQGVRDLGAQEVVVGEMQSSETLAQAATGVHAIYHICPNMRPDELAIGQAALTAAREAGVQTFVYHSVLHPQVEAMPHHWFKLRVEEALFESGLPFTILQPAAYMQNLLAQWPAITQTGLYAVPYAVETRLGMVDLEDVAEVAARVLTEPGHAGAIYELAGAEVLSQTEVATVLSVALGRPVRAEAIPRATWERGARAAGLGDYAVETLLKMFCYYERYGFWGNPRVLEGLLGCPARTFVAFVGKLKAKG